MVERLHKERLQLCSAAEEIYCIQNPPALHVVGGEAVKFRFTVPSIAAVGEPFDLHILPVDALGNESASYQGTLTFETVPGVTLPSSYRVGATGKAFIRIPGGGKISKPGVYRLLVKDEEKSLLGESNPIKIVSGPGGRRLFWGDLHVHSFESDGIGSPDKVNAFCRDIAALDFCCVSDHAVGVFDKIRQSAIKFTEPGRFLSFSGFEGRAADIPGGGHVNYYFVDDSPEYKKVIEPNKGGKPVYKSRYELWEHLLSYGEKKVIAVPHNHARGGWQEMDSPVVRLDEIYSVWGNSEIYWN